MRPEAGVFQGLSIIMRIIKELGEMQRAQNGLETSLVAILAARGSRVRYIWLC
jgi:hypothetical protein